MNKPEKTNFEDVEGKVVLRLVDLRKEVKGLFVQKSDLLKRFDNAAAAKEEESEIIEIIHTKEDELSSEIKRKINELKAGMQVDKAKGREERIKLQNFLVEFDKTMKTSHDFYSQLQVEYPELELHPDVYEPMDEQTKRVLKAINEKATEANIKLAKTYISSLKSPLKKYAWKRRISFITQQGFRIICNLIILNLVVNALITKVDPWYLNLIILPAIAWFALEYFLQPWLEKHLFSPQKRKAEKELIEGFYNAIAKIRCQIAMNESYSFVENAFSEEKINDNEMKRLTEALLPVVTHIYLTRWSEK